MFLNKRTKLVYILCLLFCATLVYSQEEYGVVKDRGASYNSISWENDNIVVPLYEIKSEDITIPIFLSHTTKGIKVSDVPSSIGYGWSLNVGGEINKQVNHLTDENVKGWLFSKEFSDYQEGVYEGTSDWDTSEAKAHQLYTEVDASPDFYRMKISNGEFLNYTFDNNAYSSQAPLIFKQGGGFYNGNISISRELLEQDSFNFDRKYYNKLDSDIDVLNKKGTLYKFRKGASRMVPHDVKDPEYYDRYNLPLPSDSTHITNYYLHRVESSANNSFVDFEYTNQQLYQYIKHAEVSRYQTDESTSPDDIYRPWHTSNYYEGVSLEDVSRKEIKKIITNREKIEFIYKEVSYDFYVKNLSLRQLIEPQKIKLLEKVYIYNDDGKLKEGYKFEYYDGSVQGELMEEDFRLKSIYKIGQNNKSFLKYRDFDYYHEYVDQGGIMTSPVSSAQDVFGYPNGKSDNDNKEKFLTINGEVDRFPVEAKIIEGMLKTITDESGLKKTYTYKLNGYENMYYGGVLIDNVSFYSKENTLLKKQQYNYEEPEGFGLPLYGQYSEGLNFEEGYFDDELMSNSWQTYFTRIDPIIDTSTPSLIAYKIISNPYKRRNTPVLDAIFQDVTGTQNEMDQVQQGVFYKKVTVHNVSVHGQTQKGKIVKHFIPSLNGFYLDKKNKKVEFYNSQNQNIKEEIYNYAYSEREEISAFKFDNAHMKEGARYVIKRLPVYIFDESLNEKITNEYVDNTLKKSMKNTFVYNSLNDVKSLTVFVNNKLRKKTELNYHRDFYATSNVGLLWRTNPVIEKNSWVTLDDNRWKLTNSLVKEFLYNGNVKQIKNITFNKATNNFYTENDFDGVYLDASSNMLKSDETNDIISMHYNSGGYLVNQINKKTKTNMVYQRGEEYNREYIDAVFISPSTYEGSSDNDYYTKLSFENSTDSDVVKFEGAYTGNYVFSGDEIDLGGTSKKVEVSFWTYKDNKWSFNSFKHEGVGNIIISKPTGVAYIDEVIVRPPNSSVTTYTYSPTGKITSKLNERGDGEFYEYDVFGRLLFIKDENKNILKEYRYNAINK